MQQITWGSNKIFLHDPFWEILEIRNTFGVIYFSTQGVYSSATDAAGMSCSVTEGQAVVWDLDRSEEFHKWRQRPSRVSACT